MTIEPTPGDPVWCSRDAAAIRRALVEIDDLAALLASWADGHRAAGSGERTSGRRPARPRRPRSRTPSTSCTGPWRRSRRSGGRRAACRPARTAAPSRPGRGRSAGCSASWTRSSTPGSGDLRPRGARVAAPPTGGDEVRPRGAPTPGRAVPALRPARPAHTRRRVHTVRGMRTSPRRGRVRRVGRSGGDQAGGRGGQSIKRLCLFPTKTTVWSASAWVESPRGRTVMSHAAARRTSWQSGQRGGPGRRRHPDRHLGAQGSPWAPVPIRGMSEHRRQLGSNPSQPDRRSQESQFRSSSRAGELLARMQVEAAEVSRIYRKAAQELVSAGLSHARIAKKTGMSPTRIGQILRSSDQGA